MFFAIGIFSFCITPPAIASASTWITAPSRCLFTIVSREDGGRQFRRPYLSVPCDAGSLFSIRCVSFLCWRKQIGFSVFLRQITNANIHLTSPTFVWVHVRFNLEAPVEQWSLEQWRSHLLLSCLSLAVILINDNMYNEFYTRLKSALSTFVVDIYDFRATILLGCFYNWNVLREGRWKTE